MITLFESLYNYFENRADADHDENGYIPNQEMHLLSLVDDVLFDLKKNGMSSDTLEVLDQCNDYFDDMTGIISDEAIRLRDLVKKAIEIQC